MSQTNETLQPFETAQSAFSFCDNNDTLNTLNTLNTHNFTMSERIESIVDSTIADFDSVFADEQMHILAEKLDPLAEIYLDTLHELYILIKKCDIEVKDKKMKTLICQNIKDLFVPFQTKTNALTASYTYEDFSKYDLLFFGIKPEKYQQHWHQAYGSPNIGTTLYNGSFIVLSHGLKTMNLFKGDIPEKDNVIEKIIQKMINYNKSFNQFLHGEEKEEDSNIPAHGYVDIQSQDQALQLTQEFKLKFLSISQEPITDIYIRAITAVSEWFDNKKSEKTKTEDVLDNLTSVIIPFQTEIIALMDRKSTYFNFGKLGYLDSLFFGLRGGGFWHIAYKSPKLGEIVTEKDNSAPVELSDTCFVLAHGLATMCLAYVSSSDETYDITEIINDEEMSLEYYIKLILPIISSS